MADLLKILQSQLGGNALDLIANQIGGNKQQTSNAVAAALPMIMQALHKNTTNEQGAASLFNAVSKDHDGSILNDVAGFVGNFQNGPGAGILQHLFGNKNQNVESVVTNTSGLNPQATSQLLQILTPLVMGQIGKLKQQNGLDIGGLANLLTDNAKIQEKKSPKSASFLNQVLDQDGDGNINDDLANMGMKLFGKFFKK